MSVEEGDYHKGHEGNEAEGNGFTRGEISLHQRPLNANCRLRGGAVCCWSNHASCFKAARLSGIILRFIGVLAVLR